MIIGNYTADVSVGETVPSPISSEPWCRKDTIRGGRVLDGGDACQVSGPVFWEREGKLRIAGFLGQGRVALASFTAWVINRRSLCNFSGGSDRVNCF